MYWNLLTEPLYEESIFRGEGVVTKGGALVVKSGIKTARSALDKFIVKESSTEDDISWGEYNIPFDEDKFNEVFSRVQAYLQGKDGFRAGLFRRC